MRFHAVGDVALVLPACNAFRRRYPNARIDLLTSPETAPLAEGIELFDKVYLMGRPDTRLEECRELFASLSHLHENKYQMIIDLQRNWKSRWIRRMLGPRAWAEFDRFGMSPASDRTLHTFHEAGFPELLPAFDLRFKSLNLQNAEGLLRAHRWHPGTMLVLLNPAGLWSTRNWPVQNYVTLAHEWPIPEDTHFLLIGTDRLRPASKVLADSLGDRLIDLTGRTSLHEAFALLTFIDLAITEDSGLMHMAWALGKPILALFGSSPHYWSLPPGERVHGFHSGDLPCGACMQPVCRYGDVRCLTRVSPASVLEAASRLVREQQRERSIT